VLTKTEGIYICGLRSAHSYIEAKKPDSYGMCPTGTTPCSTITTGSNTICYPPDEHVERCPIIDIGFSKGEEKYADYTKLDFVDGVQLVYTKLLANSRPITTTSVEYRPCHASTSYSRDEDAEFFALERDLEF